MRTTVVRNKRCLTQTDQLAGCQQKGLPEYLNVHTLTHQHVL